MSSTPNPPVPAVGDRVRTHYFGGVVVGFEPGPTGYWCWVLVRTDDGETTHIPTWAYMRVVGRDDTPTKEDS